MIAVVLALLSSVGYGLADFAGGLATRRAHVLLVSAIAAPASFAIELLAFPFLGGTWSSAAVAWGLGAGVANALALALLYQSLSMGPISVLSPVTALVSAVLPVAAGVGLGEVISPLAGLGIALALGATVAISASSDGHGTRPTVTALALAVGAGAAIAAQLICLDQSPTDSGVTPLIAGRAASSLLLVGVVLLRRRAVTAGGPLGRGELRLAITAGAMDAIASVAFILATRAGQLSIVAVITALYPAATVILARVLLHERLARLQIAGLVVAAAAVSLLALT